MKKLLTFLTLLLFFLPNYSEAQRIRGAEIDKDVIGNYVTIRAWVYRENDTKDLVLFSWGDGHIDTLQKLSTGVHSSGYLYDRYAGSHYYDTSGIVVMELRDSFLVNNVRNIENSGNQVLTLKDSLFIFPPGYPFSQNDAPDFFGSQFAVDIEGDGVVYHSAPITLEDIYNDQVEFELVPFPSSGGYTEPEAVNGIYINVATLVWDRPIFPGTYAICIKVREKRVDVLNPGDTLIMSTTHRAMMIDIDESMLVSTAVPFVKGILSLFPNPVTLTLTLQLNSFQAESATLTLRNAAGQLQHQEQLKLGPQLQQHQVDVSAWPPGVYFLRLQAGGRQVVRRFVKTG